jgi:hypothetical protein
VEQWAVVEKTAISNPSNPTPTYTAPPTVDVGTPPVFMTATQNISGTGGARTLSLAGRGGDFAGVNLLYDIQDPYAEIVNTARIYNLRLQNNTGRYILVRGIRVFQSLDAVVDPLDPGDYEPDVGSAYIKVDIVIFPNSTTRLSVDEALMSKSDGLFYAFGFQALEVTAAATCKSLANFAAVNAIYDGKCVGCHGSGNSAWSMAATPAARCLQSLQRSDLTTPNASKIIRYPFDRAFNHPGTSMNQADYDAMVFWITSER